MLYTMRRTQLYLDDALWSAMHARAKQRGVTLSELAREALRERYMNGAEARRAALLNFVGIWADRKDLLSTEKYLRQLRSGRRRRRMLNWPES